MSMFARRIFAFVISIGLEYRVLKLQAGFCDSLPGGEVDTGGNFLFATVRGHF